MLVHHLRVNLYFKKVGIICFLAVTLTFPLHCALRSIVLWWYTRYNMRKKDAQEQDDPTFLKYKFTGKWWTSICDICHPKIENYIWTISTDKTERWQMYYMRAVNMYNKNQYIIVRVISIYLLPLHFAVFKSKCWQNNQNKACFVLDTTDHTICKNGELNISCNKECCMEEWTF
jgi:hypothetical protein